MRKQNMKTKDGLSAKVGSPSFCFERHSKERHKHQKNNSQEKVSH
jgi:hypothetical protein